MKQKIIIAVLVVIILCGAIAFWSLRRDEPGFTLHGVIEIPTTAINFRVSGRVSKVFFAKNEPVQQGAMMAVLDKTSYEDALALAQTALTKAQSTLQQVTKTQERYAQLLKAGATSSISYDETVRARDEAHMQFAIAKAQVEEAQAQLAATVIYAPNSGRVLSRLVEPGMTVTENTPVYLLTLGAGFTAKAYVSEAYRERVRLEQDAVLVTDSGERYQGKVTSVSAQAELIPRDSDVAQFFGDSMYRLGIAIDNPSEQLRQGMPTTIKLVWQAN